MAENVIIRPGVLFKDRSGCLLKVVKKAKGSFEWWCAGEPDVIGLWKYSPETILKGAINEQEKPL